MSVLLALRLIYFIKTLISYWADVPLLLGRGQNLTVALRFIVDLVSVARANVVRGNMNPSGQAWNGLIPLCSGESLSPRNMASYPRTAELEESGLSFCDLCLFFAKVPDFYQSSLGFLSPHIRHTE